MPGAKSKYNCWFLINQHMSRSLFTADEELAVKSFLNFLADKDYGKGFSIFRFDIYVEPEINYGRHSDAIYLDTAHLSAHIDNSIFISSDSAKRHQYLLNAALILCNYLVEKVPLPKGINGLALINDFREYLAVNSLLLTKEQTDGVIIKPFETTKFNFIITSTAEVKEENIHYDLINLKDYLNTHLTGKTFGASVREFDFGYEIFDFKGKLKPYEQTKDLRRYGAKDKNILVVKQFDYQELKNKTPIEQFNLMRSKIIEAIQDVDKLKRKPKDFDKAAFLSMIDKLLDDYARAVYPV